MSEVQFVKTFLALLDRKAVKLNGDYVSDPRKYPAQTPYILPKPAHPYPKKSIENSSTEQSAKIDIILSPMKGVGPKLTLSKTDLDSSLLDIKGTYAKQTGLDASKIKLLYNRRPASDLKSLRELLPKPTPGQVEFTLMILGGANAGDGSGSSGGVGSPAIQVPDPRAAPGAGTMSEAAEDAPLSEQAAMQGIMYTGKAGVESSAARELESDAFWTDLQDFLIQRLRNENEGRRLVKIFKGAANA